MQCVSMCSPYEESSSRSMKSIISLIVDDYFRYFKSCESLLHQKYIHTYMNVASWTMYKQNLWLDKSEKFNTLSSQNSESYIFARSRL